MGATRQLTPEELDEYMYNFYDIYGYIPSSRRKKKMIVLTKAETSAIIKHSIDKLPNTLIGYKVTGRLSATNTMKIMTMIFYSISLLGVVNQATDIVPGIPDRITFSIIVTGLVAANIMQWRQAIKDRESNRQDLAKMHTDMMQMVANNQEAIQEILREIKS